MMPLGLLGGLHEIRNDVLDQVEETVSEVTSLGTKLIAL